MSWKLSAVNSKVSYLINYFKNYVFKNIFLGSEDPVDALFLLDQDLDLDLVHATKAQTKTKDENKENEPVKPKKRVGRKPGQKLNIPQVPYVKTEVTDSHRSSEVYGLRATVKRKWFTDLVSDPSDLDEDEEFDEIDDESDEYAPEDIGIDGTWHFSSSYLRQNASNWVRTCQKPSKRVDQWLKWPKKILWLSWHFMIHFDVIWLFQYIVVT